MNKQKAIKPARGISTASVLRRSLIFFLSSLIILISVSALFCFKEIKKHREVLSIKETRSLSTIQQVIKNYIQAIGIDILVMSNHSELKAMIETSDQIHKQTLADEFLAFAGIKGIYDQIRYLGKDGMEVLRVNYNNGTPSIVPDDELQSKKNRYYFMDTYRLNRSEVYVSPFDLNIEHGKIESPVKPMIRFGTPVFDSSGKKTGVLLLNYLGNDLLQKFKTLSKSESGQISLVNRDGYFLYSTNPDDNWGFMYEDKKDRSLNKKYPDVWKKIVKSDTGQIIYKNNLFIYSTIKPLDEAQISSTGSDSPFAPSSAVLINSDYVWKVISRIPPEVLSIWSMPSLKGFIKIYPVIIFLLFTGSVFMAFISERRSLAEKYEKIVSSSADMIALVDRQYTYLAANKAYTDAFYTDPEKLIGQSVADIFGKEPFNTIIKPHVDLCFLGEKINYQNWFDFPAYGRCYMDIYYSPYYSDNNMLIGIVVNSRNITARKEAEEALEKSEIKYRNMMESFSDPIYICSHQKVVEYMNPAMIRRLGKNTTGEKCYKSINGLSEPCKWCIFDKVIDGETVENDIISPLDNRNYNVLSMPIKNQDSTVSKMTVYRDITDLLTALEEKEKAERKLMQIQKVESIGNLAGGIAHDFNNMLGIILGYGEDLLESIDTADPDHESVEEIVKAAKRSAELTRQLLAFSRRQTLQPRVLCLNSIITNLVKMLQRVIGENIELVTVLDDDLKYVEVDPGQMEQVIVNLAINARDAMPLGGRLVIETSSIVLDEEYAGIYPNVKPGNHAMLSITDNGTGMDKETLKKAFDPFYTTKEKGKGTGLGLSTVYGIVRQSGGNVWLYSEPGHGTSVKIYLPESSSSKLDNVEKSEIPESLNGNGEMILIVEDEPSMRKFCRNILESMDYRVTAAENGIEALKLVEEKNLKPDILLTDIIMPKMGGKDLYSILAETLPDIKIIYMSGYTGNAISGSNLIHSGTAFIQKPFTRKDLGQKIKTLLNSSFQH